MKNSPFSKTPMATCESEVPIIFIGDEPRSVHQKKIRKHLPAGKSIVDIDVNIGSSLAPVYYFMETGVNLYIKGTCSKTCSAISEDILMHKAAEKYRVITL